MSSSLLKVTGAAAIAVVLSLSSQAFAQSDDQDPELRIQKLEEQLRTLTGQNEELQYRNRQLEDRLRQLGSAPTVAAPQGGNQPNVAVMPPVQSGPGYGQPAQGGQVQGGYTQPQGGYAQPQQSYPQQQEIASPAPIAQEAPGRGGRRGDAFDPSQNPNAPGAPQALGGGQMPMPAQGSAGGVPGAPLDLSAGVPPGNTQPGRQAQPGGLPPPPVNPGGQLATAPPSNSPRDEYDLGIGYMQRKDYALAEQTMKNFAQKYPGDPLVGDSQYWLGESYFQRQQYRDAAEVFLNVTSKYDKAGKAPDALLRLGQSLAALKEKEAACAAFGEVMRKYPRASAGVKAAVDREQKKVKC